MERFDDVVVAMGSGGTACGLAIANYLTGSNLKYVIITLCKLMMKGSPMVIHAQNPRC